MWVSWTYVADPGSFLRAVCCNLQSDLTNFFLLLNTEGTHAGASGSGRILGFATTVAGMLVFALMIGVVSDSIGASVDDLKRGNSKVRHILLTFGLR